MTPAQFTAVKEALDDGFNERFLQLQSDYEAVLVKPVTQGYVVRFAAAYGMVKGDHYNDKAAPYDPAAMDQAARDQREAGTKCNNQKAATSATSLECYIAAYRTFAEAIKLRDMQLFEAFVSAMRRAAADTDAGKLAPWQQYAVYEALVGPTASPTQRSYDTYLIALYRPLSLTVCGAFRRNAYMAAGGTDEETDGPPWNESAVLAARKIRDQAVQSCFDRRAELKTHTAFWECREAAEREMAVAIHTRNMLLTEKMVAATLQAANDADAGKITDDQLGAIASRARPRLRQASREYLEFVAGQTQGDGTHTMKHIALALGLQMLAILSAQAQNAAPCTPHPGPPLLRPLAAAHLAALSKDGERAGGGRRHLAPGRHWPGRCAHGCNSGQIQRRNPVGQRRRRLRQGRMEVAAAIGGQL